MEQNGAISSNRRPPSTDHFLTAFSPSVSSDIITDDELNEDDVFWTGDFSEKKHPSTAASNVLNRHRHNLRQQQSSGILAALSEDNRKPTEPVLYRTPSITRTIPSIPRQSKEAEFSQSVPAGNYQQSAPIKVPMMQEKEKKSGLGDADIDFDDDEEMLPPHELVGRGSGIGPMTTFSMLEGVGRTLKGRDLRLVRNAVWRKTGFLD